ncbi:MAG TPA: YbhB/YbcL family Raf kinase inhibitor-like protein [Solirubrobacterales bacterium]|nr:YbhB/YbcL family Raf kinase inhibitor-like protein [Solirubrobacterales bacterium]
MDASGSSGSGGGGSGGSQGANGKSADGTPNGTGGASNSPGAAGTSRGGSSANGSQPSTGTTHGAHVHVPEGTPEPGITPQQRQEATVASMLLESPAATASSAGPPALPAAYTCDGKGSPPPLRWRGVPQGTAELVLLAMNVQPIEGKLFFDWAVAGLSPDLTEIQEGKLPKGSIVGLNSFGQTGYRVCPATGAETYMFAVYALPKKLSATPGFDPTTMRKEVLNASGNVGLLALGYARG